jgi:hypothetical protein
MSFTDGSYLTGKILVPNVTYGAIDPALFGPDIEQAFNEYEPEVLELLLGYSLNEALNDDLDGNGDPQSVRFIALVDGSEFQHTYGNLTQTLKWKGFRNDEKISLCAYYTYYKYIERNVTKMSGVGNTDLKAENAERVSPIRKMTDAWYLMRKLYGIIPTYTRWKNSVLGSDLPCTFNNLSSAYNFLFANKETYPEWIFTPIKGVNIFGI